MARIQLVMKKLDKEEIEIITNVKKDINYPNNLAYDTDDDWVSYYSINYGVNKNNWPNHTGMN